jgi:putative tryptophan/tyrosine transport system substrate-binding protein
VQRAREGANHSSLTTFVAIGFLDPGRGIHDATAGVHRGLGVAVAWSRVARAQQQDRMRRIAVLMGFDEGYPDGKIDIASLMHVLADLGWIDGRNLRMDVRWSGANIDRIRMFVKELVELRPNVIVAHTTPVTAELRRATRTGLPR